MAQQYEQQRQRQRGRSPDYDPENTDEDWGARNYRNFEGQPNRNLYNPPGGGRGYGRGDYGEAGTADESIARDDPRRGRGYGRVDYGQDYGRNRSDWDEYAGDDGGRFMRSPDYARDNAREYLDPRGNWEPLRNRVGDQPSSTWWTIPGPHSGKGPQGWNRSKERIREEVCERMAQHGQLDASNLQVDVNEGQVTLSGQVNSRREKRIAEDLAESVWGVNDVNNQIRVTENSMLSQQSAYDRDK
jgi:hypothetical protein